MILRSLRSLRNLLTTETSLGKLKTWDRERAHSNHSIQRFHRCDSYHSKGVCLKKEMKTSIWSTKIQGRKMSKNKWLGLNMKIISKSARSSQTTFKTIRNSYFASVPTKMVSWVLQIRKRILKSLGLSNALKSWTRPKAFPVGPITQLWSLKVEKYS